MILTLCGFLVVTTGSFVLSHAFLFVLVFSPRYILTDTKNGSNRNAEI